MLPEASSYPIGGDGSRGARELGRSGSHLARYFAARTAGPRRDLEASPGLPHASGDAGQTGAEF